MPVTLAASGLRARDRVRPRADGVTLLDASGAPAPASWAGDRLPVALYVEGSAPGPATLTAEVEGCAPVTLELEVVDPSPMIGRSRPEAPGFGPTEVFATGQAVEVDPGDQAGPAFVVAHRSLAAWAEDPALVDVTEEVETVAEPAVVWHAAEAAPDALGSRYDLVLDLDGDRALSPGDRVDFGVEGEGFAVVGDLSEGGPHAVVSDEVSGGDWLGERVYWPVDLAGLGPRPLVVISHGNGHEHTWYDWLGEHLASWGYVVMAHENQTMPGIETASATTLTNTDWFLANLDALGLEGLVDPGRVVWMGHSRGGEGVVRAWTRVVEGEYTPTGWGADSIRGILSIAPTVFNEVTVSNPYDVRYHVISGSSDGDVTGGPESHATQWWRLSSAATGLTSTTYLYGASHEDFDCCGYDDGTGPDQLSREEVQRLARAWLLAFVADAADADPYARAVLSHAPDRLPPTDLESPVLATWHDPAALVIDDFQVNHDPSWGSSGAAVTWTVTELTQGRLDDADLELTWTGDDPMSGMTQADLPSDDAEGLVFEWESPGWIDWALPRDVRDWSGHSALSFRVCQGTRHPLTVDWEAAVDLAVTVTDTSGASVTRSVTPWGDAATPYQRGRAGDGKGWSNAFSTVRVPLAELAGVDLTEVASVRLEVGGEGQAPFGRLGLDDLEVSP